MKCGCGVSIIYLTPTAFSERAEGSTEEEQDQLEQGNLFDRNMDKLEESRLRQMYERVLLERNSQATE